MNRFEEQLKEYLNKTDMTEGDLNSVPLIVCWYEGLISTELLLMELSEMYILDAKRQHFSIYTIEVGQHLNRWNDMNYYGINES